MKLYQVKANDHFIGRQKELSIIADLQKKEEAQILICYGRRRVGKTELIEQIYTNAGCALSSFIQSQSNHH